MKLLIVDDHPVVLEGLSNVMQRKGYDVLKAQDATQALKIASLNPDIDIFIVDLALKSDTDGLPLISELKTHCGNSHAIVYTMHGEAWNLRMLFQAGVEGIVLKGDSIDELLEAVSVVKDGSVYRSKEFIERYDALSSAHGIMSKRELDVLRLISEGASTKDIADSMCLSEKAVEYHRSNILKKLGSNNMAHAINQAVRLGILTCIAAMVSVNAVASVPEPEAVDLGLSVKWANCNLGATSPIGEGEYFAFGEVAQKDYYNWDTYLYCYNGNWMSQFDFEVESLCGTEYDAAHELLGGNWRMPNEEECMELIDNCSVEYIPADPLNYMRLTGPNGASIEVPFTGTMSLDRVINQNKDTAMWSGSYYVESGEEDSYYYWINGPSFLGADFKDHNLNVYEGNPYFGMQIRPVYAESSSVSYPNTSSRTVEAVYSIEGRCISGDAASLPSGVYIYRYSDGSSSRHLVK